MTNKEIEIQLALGSLSNDDDSMTQAIKDATNSKLIDKLFGYVLDQTYKGDTIYRRTIEPFIYNPATSKNLIKSLQQAMSSMG